MEKDNMDYERRTTDAKLNRLEVEVSAIKEKISFFSVIYQKFDDTLDKVQKMIEDRRNETNHDLKDVYSKISEVETKIMDEIHSMREDMKKQHEEERKKISELDKWRWMVMGAAGVVGWIASKLTNIIP
jgi:vacuolar-type H+-ATPase subunit I/STV1